MGEVLTSSDFLCQQRLWSNNMNLQQFIGAGLMLLGGSSQTPPRLNQESETEGSMLHESPLAPRLTNPQLATKSWEYYGN
jgi:hypothetical protein